MATPRKRYFKVADKVLREPWANDDLASLIRLMAYLNTRWARDYLDSAGAGVASISVTDLMAISGKRRADVARKSAERWRDIAGISVEHQGEVTLISWPKFAIFQDFPTRPEPDDVPKRALSGHSSSDSPSTLPQKNTKKAAPSGAPPASRSGVGFPLSAWSSAKEAAAAYGKRWNRKKPPPSLRARYREHREDFGEDCIAHAVHGYMAFHRILRDGYDPMKYLVPETIFRASNCAKYLDAYVEAVQQGLSPPFEPVEPERPRSFAEQQEDDVMRVLEDIDRERQLESKPRIEGSGGAVHRVPERSH